MSKLSNGFILSMAALSAISVGTTALRVSASSAAADADRTADVSLTGLSGVYYTSAEQRQESHAHEDTIRVDAASQASTLYV
jgi:hypothetical protein